MGPVLNPDSTWPDAQLDPTNRDGKLSRLSERISESLRDIIELIKQRKRRFPFKYPKYDSEEERKLPDYYDEEFRSSVAKYQYRPPHQRILDDYPPADEDFSFHERDREVEAPYGRHEAKDVSSEEAGSPLVLNGNSAAQEVPVEASGKGALEEAPADNPEDFAYSPFDPRYYENTSSTGTYLSQFRFFSLGQTDIPYEM